MQITLENVSKRYLFDWIFKNVSYTFAENTATAITGNNGSGKSTLIKTILGTEQCSSGKIRYQVNQKEIPADSAYQHFDFVAPYQQLIEEFSAKEMIRFHFQFKKKNELLNIHELLKNAHLDKTGNKPIALFSSGMKQRLKLILAFCSNAPTLLLDEPTVNLDQQGIDWYRENMQQLLHKRTILISSNQSCEFDFCDKKIEINDYKA